MQTVVVLRDLGLGDLLTGLPALRALARSHPAATKVLVAPDWLAPLALATGTVDRVVSPPEVPVAPALAVNLHGRGPQSHRRLLALAPRRLVAFRHPEVPGSGPEWRDDEHEVHRWCRLVDSDGHPADPADLDLPWRWRRSDLTVVHPGAGFGAKRWPAERFARVAAAEARRGRAVLVTAGSKEERLSAEVAARAGLPSGCDLGGRLSLLDLARLVGSAGRVVCGDTGVAHLAVALRTPSVTLYGPVPPSLWGPPPDRWWHVALWSGSTGDRFASQPDPGLLRIEVEEVDEALRRLPSWEEVPPVSVAAAG